MTEETLKDLELLKKKADELSSMSVEISIDIQNDIKKFRSMFNDYQKYTDEILENMKRIKDTIAGKDI